MRRNRTLSLLNVWRPVNTHLFIDQWAAAHRQIIIPQSKLLLHTQCAKITTFMLEEELVEEHEAQVPDGRPRHRV